MEEYRTDVALPGWGCCWVPTLPPSSGLRGDKEPKNKRLTQQALPACKPVLDTLWVVFIYISAGVVLVPIGAICLAYGQKAEQVSSRYDQTCFPVNQTQVSPSSSNDARQQYLWKHAANDTALSCTMTVTIPNDMPAPIYVFYEMDKFLQNHRRYVVSRSDQQLVNKGNPDTAACPPQLSYGDNESRTIDPCGLTAWSNFNDTFQNWQVVRKGVVVSQGSNLVSTSGIAPPLDQKYKFASYMPQWFNPVINSLRGGANITVPVQQDEHFIVWMRLAPLPTFRKLWGVINTQNLLAGDRLQVTVTNRYNSFAYGGQKSLVLSTVTWLGVPNLFMALVFLATGGLAVLLGCVYMVTATVIKPRRLGDLTVLPASEWSRE